MVQLRGRLRDELNAQGEPRVRVWIGHLLGELWYDDSFATMPSLARSVKPAERAEVVACLLQRN